MLTTLARGSLVVFENKLFGRALALDDIMQTTTRDEFFYHEMMVHVPLYAVEKPRRVLIIGGGDGGILREVMKHAVVESCTMIEIDPSVTELGKKYFPAHSAGAFDDSRVTLKFEDGAKFVAETQEKFDAIIVDSTDPVGPGKVLFEPAFYENCKRALTDEGVLVTQNGVPFLQAGELASTSAAWRALELDFTFFRVSVPTYVGGDMACGFASRSSRARTDSDDRATMAARFAERPVEGLRYYTPAVHSAAFAMPKYMSEIVAGNTSFV